MSKFLILNTPRKVSLAEMKKDQLYVCAGNKGFSEVTEGELFTCREKHDKSVMLIRESDQLVIEVPCVDIWYCMFHPVEVVGTVGDTMHVRYI